MPAQHASKLLAAQNYVQVTGCMFSVYQLLTIFQILLKIKFWFPLSVVLYEYFFGY